MELKEIVQRIETLEEENAALKARVAELEKCNKALEKKVVWLDIHTDKIDPEAEYMVRN